MTVCRSSVGAGTFDSSDKHRLCHFVGGGCEQISSSDKQDKLAHNCANWGEGKERAVVSVRGSMGVVIGLVHQHGFVKFM